MPLIWGLRWVHRHHREIAHLAANAPQFLFEFFHIRHGLILMPGQLGGEARCKGVGTTIPLRVGVATPKKNSRTT